MTTRESSAAPTLIDLAGTLVSDFELVDYLDGLLSQALGVLKGDAGGVILRTGDNDPELEQLASTGPAVDVFQAEQLRLRQGPSIESIELRCRVAEDDLTTATRWSPLTTRAVEAGYQSVVAFPMRLRDHVIGALTVLSRGFGPAGVEDVRTVQALADMATIGILQERALQEAHELTGQLQSALRTRVVIEQAKGMLAEQARIEVRDAFEMLRRYCRNHGRRLRDVAAEVIAGELCAQAIVCEHEADVVTGGAADGGAPHVRPGAG